MYDGQNYYGTHDRILQASFLVQLQLLPGTCMLIKKFKYQFLLVPFTFNFKITCENFAVFAIASNHLNIEALFVSVHSHVDKGC